MYGWKCRWLFSPFRRFFTPSRVATYSRVACITSFTFAIPSCISRDNRSGSVMYLWLYGNRKTENDLRVSLNSTFFWTHFKMVTGKLFKDTNITVVPRRGSQELSNKKYKRSSLTLTDEFLKTWASVCFKKKGPLTKIGRYWPYRLMTALPS